jgi:BirA family transcriptional regulator, biotin operon repressor / biotin---[acetyl-CoA-carboxylase] ligase
MSEGPTKQTAANSEGLAPFDVKQFLGLLRAEGCALGEPFHYFESVASTNDLAKQAQKAGAAAGSLFLAETQTAGRGRHGRSWFSPAGSGLWFSLLVEGSRLPEPQCLTLLVGVALRRALAKYCSSAPKIKWPNDIEVLGHKLAGVLVEAELSSSLLVVGIGVNLSTDFEGTELKMATTLKQAATRTSEGFASLPPREGVLVEILRELAVQLQAYQREGLRATLDELRSWDALRGSLVRVGAAGVCEGIAAGFDDQGRLILQTESGSVSLGAGTVERVASPS